LQVDVTGEFQSQGVVLATPTFLSHLLLACRRKQKLDIAKLHNLLAKKKKTSLRLHPKNSDADSSIAKTHILEHCYTTRD
jgi:hypothetical protein